MRLHHALLVISAVMLAGCNKLTSTISIPKDKLQMVADAMVPVDLQEKADLPFQATLTKAEVILEQGSDQIGIQLSYTAQPPAPPFPKPPAPPFGGPPSAPKPVDPEEPITGMISVTGELSYKNGSFYFKNPTVQNLEAAGMKKDHGGPLSTAAQKIVSQHLEENAIYSLDDETTKSKMAKAVIKSVEVNNGSLLVTLGM
ncbi:DUF1439 domain-containing protein [Haloferula sp.]|uniref:DUF1439 domain-containing protein n=1 Tax=Haloferula sp. TaxID=2497595 RepID=UPI0032A06713